MASSRGVASVLSEGAFGESEPRVPRRTADPGASAWILEPAVALYHHQLLKEGNFPLWNPHMAYGAPAAANMQAPPFFPLTFLLSLYPNPDTFDGFIVLRLLIAGFFSYLFLRFFLGQGASLLGGAVFMLSGYLILYIHSCHLSVEVLLPMVFYCMEWLLRTPSGRAVLGTGACQWLAIVAGMPQSIFLVLMYGYAYFLFRVATDAGLRKSYRLHLKNLLLACFLGFGAAMFLLAPFAEFLSIGYDNHRPSSTGDTVGLKQANDARYLLLDLLPLAAGPVDNNIFKPPGDRRIALTGYSGLASVVLAVLAALALARGRESGKCPSRPIIFFFVVSIVLFILKSHGHVAVNWIGSLPIFNLIFYHKYLKPLLGFAVAMLAAFGFSRLVTGRVGLPGALAAPALVMVLLGSLAWSFKADLAATAASSGVFYAHLWLGIAVLSILAFAMAISSNLSRASGRTRVRRVAMASVALIAVSELLLNYIYPMYYVYSRPASESLDPYRGAPYVDFVQSRRTDFYRIFARDGLLHPNWSSAFGLYDVRNLDGIYWTRYMNFVRDFLTSARVKSWEELEDRSVRRDRRYPLNDWKAVRFLQLSSVRYLASEIPLTSEGSMVAAILRQNKELGPRPWRPGRPEYHAQPEPASSLKVVIEDEAREVLSHPLSSVVSLTTTIPEAMPFLELSPVLLYGTYSESCKGVAFSLRIEAEEVERHTIFKRYMTFKEHPEPRWLGETLDLRRFAGREVTFFFRAVGGPADAQGLAGWGGLRFVSDPETPALDRPAQLELVYDGEAMVFQYVDSLPRASIFHAVELVESADAALARLQDEELDIWRRVVVSTENLRDRERRALEALAGGAGERARAAEITLYGSQRVRIAAQLERPGLLMLTDSNYPGWKAYVDGVPAPILEADYLFRGVLLPAGSHEVEFRYRPASYFYGGLISLLSLFIAGIYAARESRQTRSAASTV